MGSPSEHGMVVGIAGQGETALLRWVAEEADRRHLPVTLVHAVGGMLPPPPPIVVLADGPVMEVAQAVVADAVSDYRSLHDDVPPDSTVIRKGRPGPVLAELSAGADLVVVGHRHLGPVRRVVTGSTATSVAAHARCPVVVVPERWAGSGVEQSSRWVTVGVHEAEAPPAALEAAFEAARLHGWGVRLVHAWRADGMYDDIVVRRIDPSWRERVEEQMRTAAEPLRATSDVAAFDVLAVHDWPAEALTHLARESALLVVGRRGPGEGLPHRLGSVARAVVRTAECPVMVVPV